MKIYAIYLSGDTDCHGVSSGKGRRVIALLEYESDVEKMIRDIKSNPYFSGNMSVTTFETGVDYSGYSGYTTNSY